MKEFQNKRRFKRMFHSRYAIALLILLCACMVRPVLNAREKYEKSRAIHAQASKEYALLQQRKESLDRKVASLATPQGKEREIREKFGLVKEGEYMIILIDEPKATTTRSSTTKESFWSRFVDFFQ